MSSIKMVALRKHPFGTGEREAGDEYEANADESAILIALKWAKKAEAKKAPVVEEKVVKAEPAKGKYQTRDMKAKD